MQTIKDRDDQRAIVKSVRAAYREVKGERVESALFAAMTAAYETAQRIVADIGVKWVAGGNDCPCAERRDNTPAARPPWVTVFQLALANPGHLGCQCELALVDE